MCHIPFPIVRETWQLSYAAQCLRNLKGLSIVSLNMCSVVRKFDCIKQTISSSTPDVFALNETFLNHSTGDNELHIDGYNIVRSDRTTASGEHGGEGILICTKDHYDIQCLPNSKFCTPNVESVWLCINLVKSHPILVACIYRPPDASIDACLIFLRVREQPAMSSATL